MLPQSVLTSMVNVCQIFDENLAYDTDTFVLADMGESSIPTDSPSTPTKTAKKGWGIGLPSLWIVNQTHLPKLSESEFEDNDSNPAATFHMEDSFSDNTTQDSSQPVLILESRHGSQEAPELNSIRQRQVAHGQLEGKMRRNTQSFDQQVLESASDMPIPMDFTKQQDGFVTSLYKSLQGVARHRAPTSQPSSAENSRCNSPTGFLADKVRENQLSVAEPGVRNKGREAFFRDLNITGPSSW